MNIGALMKTVEEKRLRKDVPVFRIGDTIRVNIRIKEGEKFRVQPFEGVVIARRGSGLASKFCVRRISYSVGVEKTFPLHSPLWDSIRVLRPAAVKRAKLRYFFQNPNKVMKFKEDPRRLAQAAPVEAEKPAAVKETAAPVVQEDKKKISSEKAAKLRERRAKKKEKRSSREEFEVKKAAKAAAGEPVAAAAAAAAPAEKAEEKKA